MNTFHDIAQLDTIIPGVSSAYERLRSRDGRGLYTSRGRFFNRTIFGRDAAMSAKFVADFDHQATVEVIAQLIALQGVEYNAKTQEEPGRIHHEWRDFTLWHGTLFERLPFWLLHSKWDIRNKRLLSYYSLDTTAAFIRMVHKYATRIDPSILERVMKDKHGEPITVTQALERAAQWIESRIDDNGLVTQTRLSSYSLPVQTFQDSLYSRSDGRLINLAGPVAYIEVQAFAADALRDMTQLFPAHEHHRHWRAIGALLHRRTLEVFRRDDEYFAAAIDTDGQVDVANVSAGWILNAFSWRDMKDEDRQHLITPIVERLFSDDFLTAVGLRTRAMSAADPLGHTIDYHGSQTVWPMFSFMVVEGLRRHRMYELAEQLEIRIVNGLNAVGGFVEFHTVLRDGTVVLPDTTASSSLSVQMKPEQNIGFSVVPAMVLARRVLNPPERKAQKTWQHELEQQLLKRINLATLAAPTDARAVIGRTERRRFVRWRAGITTARYFYKHRAQLSVSRRKGAR